jgi:hypothetical protein
VVEDIEVYRLSMIVYGLKWLLFRLDAYPGDLRMDIYKLDEFVATYYPRLK